MLTTKRNYKRASTRRTTHVTYNSILVRIIACEKIPTRNVTYGRKRLVQQRKLIRIPLIKEKILLENEFYRRLSYWTRDYLLVAKGDELANLVKVYNFCLVFITETLLCDKIFKETIQIPGMTVIRKDRTVSKGGGIALYISNNIPDKNLSEFS